MRPTALVLCSLGIGGLLTAVPALRGLRRAGMRVVLACPPELSELAALTGAVDRLLPTLRPATLQWPEPEPQGGGRLLPDLAVNLRDGGPQGHRLLLEHRPHRLWAYANDTLPWIEGPRWDPGEHDMLRWCRLLHWYGIPADPDDQRLPRPMVASPAPGAVLIHPAGPGLSPSRCSQGFAALARAMADDGVPVAITGSARERPTALLVAARAVLPPQLVLAGRTSVRRLCALVAAARLLVTGEPGMAGLAASYGTPCLLVTGGSGQPAGELGGEPAQVSLADVVGAASRALDGKPS